MALEQRKLFGTDFLLYGGLGAELDKFVFGQLSDQFVVHLFLLSETQLRKPSMHYPCARTGFAMYWECAGFGGRDLARK